MVSGGLVLHEVGPPVEAFLSIGMSSVYGGVEAQGLQVGG